MMILLVQSTFLLLVAILAANCFHAVPARAHRLFLAGLASVLLLPILSLFTSTMGWGFLPTERQDRTAPTNELTTGLLDTDPYADQAASRPLFEGRLGNEFLLPESDRSETDFFSTKLPGSPSFDGSGGGRLNEPELAGLSRPIGSSNNNSASQTDPANTKYPEKSAHGFSDWSLVSQRLLYFLWIALSLVAAIRLLAGSLSARRIIHSSQPLVDQEIEAALQNARRVLEIRRPIDLAVSNEIGCPVIWNWGRSQIIVPVDSLGKRIDWRSVFIHELAHLKRQDHWSSLIAELANCLMPWHPLVIYCRRRMYRLSEVVCDAWAIQFSDGPDKYVESLLAFGATPRRPVFSSMAADKSNLRHRVERILSGRGLNPRSGFGFSSLVLLLSLMTTGTVAMMKASALPIANETGIGGVNSIEPAIDASEPEKPQPPLKAEPAAQDQHQYTDQQWIEIMISVPEGARWFVGKNIGVALSQMPGNRGYRILSQCWDRIDPSARCQIMKGFTPGFGIHRLNPNYFDVLDLGMRSPENKIREFAESYNGWMTLQHFRDDDAYQEWRNQTEGMSPEQIVAAGCRQFAEDIENWDAITLVTKLKSINKTAVNFLPLKNALVDVGLVSRMEEMLRSGELRIESHEVADAVAQWEPDREVVRIAVLKELERMVDAWKEFAGSDDQRGGVKHVWDSARNLGEVNDPIMIPTMIGLIDADNDYDTIYGIGYFGLSKVTGVDYSVLHDGAWWRRWWAKNRNSFPDSVASLDIPDFPKSWRAANYEPYPQSLETLDGALDWMIKRQQSGKEYHVVLKAISDQFDDPRAIPTLIGLIDADNSSDTIRAASEYLENVTTVRYSEYHDGSWWRTWWQNNKSDFPSEVQAIPIPDLPKTAHGESHVSNTYGLETLDGKIEYLKFNEIDSDEFQQIIISVIRQMHSLTSADIPKLIGLIDCDNSSQTISIVGNCLNKVTDVKNSPLHDGAWWRRWWEENRESFPAAAGIPIPQLLYTKHGELYQPFPAGLESIDAKISFLNTLDPLENEKRREIYLSMSDHDAENSDDTAIPKLIGVIDSDNSYDTVYGIAAFKLGRSLSDVPYSPHHDGAWWRRWWARNKSKYSAAAQATPIPDVKKSAHGIGYQPFPEQLDSLAGTIEWIREGFVSAKFIDVEYLAVPLLEHGDPTAIPVIIGWMLADNSTDILRFHGRVFEKMTGVGINRQQTPAWWKEWWEQHKNEFPASTRDTPVPDLTQAVALFRVNAEAAQRQDLENNQEQEFEGIPSLKKTIDGDERKTYFQIGPAKNRDTPKNGWKVMLILPGGDGSADFNAFCRRIHKHALPKDYIAIELVAPVWSDDENRVVWPTKNLNPQKAKFTTEEFIRNAVADLKSRIEIDDRHVFALGWSSSGPAVYANSVSADSPVTGSFVAMSVFQPQNMASLKRAEEHPYFILHSPEDWIKIDQHAEVAEKQLKENGAITKLQTYNGGHGWREDPFGHINRGTKWLEKNLLK